MMNFPILNLTLNMWGDPGLDLSLIVYETPYLYTRKESIIKDYVIGCEFVDAKGNVFEAKETKRINSLISIIPGFRKEEVLFVKCDKSYSFNEIKEKVLSRVRNIEDKGSPMLKVKFAQVLKQIEGSTDFETLYFSIWS